MSGTTFKLSGFDRFPIRRGFALSRFVAFAILLAICGNILYAGQAKPKNRENRHEIEQLEETWRTAMVKSDTAAMSALLADDFIAITASGTLQTKEETLANLRSHRLHITSLAVSDRKLRFYGKTALVTSLAYVQGTTPDGDITTPASMCSIRTKSGRLSVSRPVALANRMWGKRKTRAQIQSDSN
jgi:ketosteroid isomerase-like protein